MKFVNSSFKYIATQALPMLLFFMLLLPVLGLAQVKIGNNPTVINPVVVLEIESTNKVFLPPRMTTTQRDAISMPSYGFYALQYYH